jgi:hypothetical protein
MPSWLILPSHTNSVCAPVFGSTCQTEPFTPSSSATRRLPDGAYHFTGSSRFQSLRWARIVLAPVSVSSLVRAPLPVVSDTVKRKRPLGSKAIMSFSPGTEVCVGKAFGPGVAASPRCITFTAEMLGDHSMPLTLHRWGASSSGTNPSRARTDTGVSARAEPAARVPTAARAVAVAARRRTGWRMLRLSWVGNGTPNTLVREDEQPEDEP